MKKQHVLSALLIAFALVVPAGMARAQTAEAAPVAGVGRNATIKGSATHKHKIYKSYDERLVITHLDGKSLLKVTPAFFFTGYAKYPEEISVAPGRHYIDVLYDGGRTTFSNVGLWLDAEAQKTYQLRRKLSGYSIQVWIEEVDSGNIVGGIKGSEPEAEDALKN